MIEQLKNNKFGVFDYVVFASMLAGSASIGIYFAFKSRWIANGTADYLTGGRKMSVFPISMSLIASWWSGVSYLGNSTEIYYHGTEYVFICIGVVLTGLASAYIFLPVFIEMEVLSTYEYFEKRFDKKVRLFGSIAFSIFLLSWLPVNIYVSALAFNQVTGINVHIITTCISAVCIFYTTIGGLKAVVWTDVIQIFIMIGTLIVLIVKGTLDIGGFEVLWQRAQAGDRIDAPSVQLDFTDRHSLWSLSIGAAVFWIPTAVINQNMIQRYMALGTLKHVKTALWIFIFGIILSISLGTISGLVVYATYYDCDPLTTKLVKAKDQLLPLFALRVFGDYPGMPGLFVAGVFSACLSSLSTGLNSMSAIVLEDFIKALFPRRKLNNKARAVILKSVAVTFGALCIGLASLVEKLGTLLQLTLSLQAINSGPCFGLFCGGMLIPWINAKGAFYGGLLGMGVSGFVILSSQRAIAMGQIQFPTKPVSVEGCDYFYNTTSIIAADVYSAKSDVFPLLKMSYLWFTLFGAIVTIILALIISCFTGFNDPSEVNPLCLSPVIRKYLPKRRVNESEELRDLKNEGKPFLSNMNLGE